MSLKKSYKKIIDSAIKLHAQSMIPSYLAYKLIALKEDDDEKYLIKLRELTAHYMRVKGYYKKYPYMEHKYNVEIRDYLERSENE